MDTRKIDDLKLKIEEQRNLIRASAPTLAPKGDAIVKCIRVDENNYFRRFVEMIVPPHKKYPLRKLAKRTLTVTGNGIYRRKESEIEDERNNFPVKKPQYDTSQKKGFSKFQSATMILTDFCPALFGNTNRGEKLVGVLLEETDVLYSDRNYIYDGGTVTRPYDFYALSDAQNYVKAKVGSILFSANAIDKFKSAIKNKINYGKHNEVLVRMRWNLDTSKLIIGSDTLGARLWAKEFARILKNYLLLNNLCDKSYQIPIIYYLPTNPALHFKEYSDDEYQLDREFAKLISDIDMIQFTQTFIDKHDYEVLFEMEPNQLLHVLTRTDTSYPCIYDILYTGYIPVFISLNEKVGGNRLYKFIEEYLKSLKLDSTEPSDSMRNSFYKKIIGNILYYAYFHYNSELFDLILHIRGNEPFEYLSMDVLNLAVERNDVALVERIIGCAKSINMDIVLTNLNSACSYGRIEIVKLLLTVKDIYFFSSGLQIPLLNAVQAGHYEVVQILLKNDACISYLPEHYKKESNLILAACRYQHFEILKLLLESIDLKEIGIDFYQDLMDLITREQFHEKLPFSIICFVLTNIDKDMRTKYSFSGCLNIFINYGQIDIIRFLIDAGIYNSNKHKFNLRILEHYQEKGKLSEFLNVLRNTESDYSGVSSRGDVINSPLMLAAIKGDTLKFDALIVRGYLDIVHPDIDILSFLVEIDDFHMFNHALLVGADPNNWQALYNAVNRGKLDMVKRLIAAGASIPNLSRLAGLLGCAIVKNYSEIVGVLLQAGADPNHYQPGYQSGYQSGRPLEIAILERNVHIVKLLLAAKANISETMIRLAIQVDSHEIFDLLLRAGAATSSYHFYVALSNNKAEIVQSFLEWDAIDFRAKLYDKMSALEFAEAKGFTSIVDILKKEERNIEIRRQKLKEIMTVLQREPLHVPGLFNKIVKTFIGTVDDALKEKLNHLMTCPNITKRQCDALILEIKIMLKKELSQRSIIDPNNAVIVANEKHYVKVLNYLELNFENDSEINNNNNVNNNNNIRP